MKILMEMLLVLSPITLSEHVFALSLSYFSHGFACFSQFLGLSADSYHFYEECKFLLGTGLIKSLHLFSFPVPAVVEVLLYTRTHKK